MVVQVGRVTALDTKEYQALAEDLGTDGKPKLVLTENNTGSTYHVVDAGKVFTWHVNAWYEI